MNDCVASEHPRWGTRRRRFVLAGCGVLLLLLGLVWFRLLTAPRLEASLADGRVVKITAFTYGTRHRHVHGPPWVKPFAFFLPASWQRRFGV
ncbi:MAG TPA: hypothetical protein VNZ22_06750, partial [Bacillota bacterium]|nr:hypothetical protein [Bacillota bacterium]